MARSTTRPLRYYHLEDGRNMVLSSEIIAVVGAAPNGSDQGHWVVAAYTKVAAAARATEVIGRTFRPQQFQEAVGTRAAAVIHARLLLGEGDLVAWRRDARDNLVVRVARGADRTDIETVAHWRIEGSALHLVPVHRDATLLPVRPVTIARPEISNEYVGGGRGLRTTYPGGVATYVDDNATVWISGLGHLNIPRAEEILRGLAGALTDLEDRR